MKFNFFHRTIGAIFIAACFVTSADYAPAAELPKLVVPEGLGVNIHFVDPKAGEMEMLVQGGFRFVRMDFFWESTEWDKGTYEFAAYDRLMDNLDKYHLRAVLILDYANRHYDDGLSPASEEGRQAFARWAAAAAKHFRGRGILWEMYNEPNIEFWKPKPDVKQYVKLALAVGKAMREAAPDELYIGPATSTIDFPFLDECFRSGLLKYWSAVSVHPYREFAPETVADEYARLRKMIDQYEPKDKKIPILSGEWGYSSAWKDVDGERQGKMLARQWLTNLMCEVPLSIWYDWHDDGEEEKNSEHHFGTVLNPYSSGRTPVYRPKPAYWAAQTLTRLLNGYRFQRRLTIGGSADCVMAFANGDQLRWVAWTTAAASHTVLIPLPAGRYTATRHTGESLPALVADAKGLSIVLSDAPTYLVPEHALDWEEKR